MSYKCIIYAEKDRIAVITLNQPKMQNVLSLDLINEMTECLTHIGQALSTKVVIIKGAEKNFCAGHDINEVLHHDLDDTRHLFQKCSDMMILIHEIPQPVIAQIHGIATAAGCQLVAACDLAVAEEGARFATPGVKIGLFCSTPMVPLTRTIGKKKSLEMLLTGEYVSAEEALKHGLVNRVVPLDKLDEDTWDLAGNITQHSLDTISRGKKAFYEQQGMSETQAYQYAKEVISVNAQTPDAVEGMSAFLEKRVPVWKEN